MKTFWILMAIVSSTASGDYEVYKFDNVSFDSEFNCIQFAQENYSPINIQVNTAYKTEGILYDFACISNEEYKILLNPSTEN